MEADLISLVQRARIRWNSSTNMERYVVHSHATHVVLSHNQQYEKEGGTHLIYTQSSNQAFQEVHPSLQGEAQQAEVLSHIQRIPQGIKAKRYDMTIERLVCYGV